MHDHNAEITCCWFCKEITSNDFNDGPTYFPLNKLRGKEQRYVILPIPHSSGRERLVPHCCIYLVHGQDLHCLFSRFSSLVDITHNTILKFKLQFQNLLTSRKLYAGFDKTAEQGESFFRVRFTSEFVLLSVNYVCSIIIFLPALLDLALSLLYMHDGDIWFPIY